MNIKRHRDCPCTQEDIGRRKQTEVLPNAMCDCFQLSSLCLAFTLDPFVLNYKKDIEYAVAEWLSSIWDLLFVIVVFVVVGGPEGAGWTSVRTVFSPFFFTECRLNRHKNPHSVTHIHTWKWPSTTTAVGHSWAFNALLKRGVRADLFCSLGIELTTFWSLTYIILHYIHFTPRSIKR